MRVSREGAQCAHRRGWRASAHLDPINAVVASGEALLLARRRLELVDGDVHRVCNFVDDEGALAAVAGEVLELLQAAAGEGDVHADSLCAV